MAVEEEVGHVVVAHVAGVEAAVEDDSVAVADVGVALVEGTGIIEVFCFRSFVFVVSSSRFG